MGKLNVRKKIIMFRKYWPVSKYFFYHLFKKTGSFFGLTFHITNKCNARCVMCFNWQTLNKNYQDLTLEEIDKFSKTMGLLPNLSLSGGEPFLREDLVEICKIFYKNNKIKKIAIPTNCLLPDLIIKKTEELLKSCPIRLKLCLSVDGRGKTHDQIRRVDGAFEKFQETFKKIIPLTEKFFQLQININTTISNKNEGELIELVNYINKYPQIKFHNLELIRGAFDQESVSTPATEKYEKLIESVILKSKSLDNDEYHKKIYASYHRLAVDILRKKKQLIPCRAAFYIPVIDALGNVYHCEILPPLGNLKDCNYNFQKIWHSEKAKKQRQDIAQKKCYCTHLCYQIQNIPMSPYHLLKTIMSN